jgi:hypothetical protein
MRTAIRAAILGLVMLAAGCVVEPAYGPGPHYYHHHCDYYHCW